MRTEHKRPTDVRLSNISRRKAVVVSAKKSSIRVRRVMGVCGASVLVFALSQCASSGSSTAGRVRVGSAPVANSDLSWQQVSGPTFADQTAPALVVSNSQIVAVGQASSATPGSDSAVQAVTFDAASKTFGQASSASPLQGVADISAVAVGPTIVVAGIDCATPTQPDSCGNGNVAAATYTSPDQKWQPIDVPTGGDFSASPAVGGLSAVGVIGSSAVFLATQEDSSARTSNTDFIAFDVTSSSWRSLGSPKLSGVISGACATDAGIVAFGSHDLYNGEPVSRSTEAASSGTPIDPTKIETTGPDAAEYSASDQTWRSPATSSDLRVNMGGYQFACWPGGVIAYGAVGNQVPLVDVATQLDPSSLTWTQIAPPHELAITTEHAWTGNHLVFWGQADPTIRPSFTYDPSTNVWTPEPPGPLASTEVGADGVVLAYHVSNTDGAATWTLATGDRL